MKTQNAIFGRSRKSFGSATAYTMNGQNIVRTKPIAVANPRTTAQTLQRTRFNAFTKAANSLPEDELNALIPDKELGRNRRTTLQAQLAPAYGARVNDDPAASDRYQSTFNVTKVGDLGTGEVGYVGDLIECTISNGQITLPATEKANVMARVTNTLSSDAMALILISEDGCQIEVRDTGIDYSTLLDEIEDGGFNVGPTGRLGGHGTLVYAGVVKKKEHLQLIGLGTFSVAKRSASESHNVPV